MNDITFPIVLVAGIGILCGVVLAIASIIMAVPKDEKEIEIRDVLPGANCGACGFSGCDGYAAALAKGEAQPGLCAPGGAAVAAATAKILGGSAGTVEEKVAVVHCLGSNDNTQNKVVYEGIESCAAANIVAGGVADCEYGCMGIGDCVNACQYDAIEVCNGVARVDPTRCKGCTMCVKACPKHLIDMVPKKKQAVNLCQNCDKGPMVMKVCKVGCIGCMKCVKACPQGAIKVDKFHAIVDPSKCIGCGACIEVCPRHCLKMMDV